MTTLQAPLARRRLLLGAGALGLGALASRRLPWLDAGPMRHEAYVWQRSWGPRVVAAVEGAAADVSGLVALAAELVWNKPTHLVQLDAGALARSGASVGLALRVHSLPREPGAAEVEAVAGALRASVERAASAGLRASEIQIDFDCPASRLLGYRTMLLELRRRAPAPLVFTALPSWLHRPEFVALASAADGYVLQVHGLDPANLGPGAHFDRARARRAVDLAGALGAPFRVALPTYGYRVAIDEQQRLAGIAAEGPANDWGEGVDERRVAAPAGEVAALVRSLTEGRPRAMRGLLWYRLPVAGDRLNWSMTTLRSVQRGVAPRGRLVVEAERDDGAWAIGVRNDGDGEASLRRVALRWGGARLLAQDALAGLAPAERRDDRLVWEAARPVTISPGERRALGWLRLDGQGQVEADVEDETAG